jgi:predicted RNA methylase
MGTQNRRLGSVWAVDDAFEMQRLTLQVELDSLKTIEERRKLGQFATPTALARDIVSFGLKHIDSKKDIRFFDPAFGTGAFCSALFWLSAILLMFDITLWMLRAKRALKKRPRRCRA